MRTTRSGEHTIGPDGLPELRVTRTLACGPAELWGAVTKPDVLELWFGNVRLTEDHFGQFEITAGPMAGVSGMTLVCQPPHTYQVTWDEPPGAPTKLLVEVVESPRGCELVLTHRGLSTSRAPDYESRWITQLDQLASYAERGPRAEHPAS